MVTAGIDQRLPGSRLRAERVDDAVSDAVDHGGVADIAVGEAGNNFVLVIRRADVVIPTLGHTVEAQHQTLAGVLVFGLAGAGSGFAPVQINGLSRVETGDGRTGRHTIAGVVG